MVSDNLLYNLLGTVKLYSFGSLPIGLLHHICCVESSAPNFNIVLL